MRGFQPFAIGGELRLFLTNFERTCTRMGFERASWPQRLLSLLPAEAADVLARLGPEEAERYADVKSALLAKYRLSPEAFRLKFREAVKHPGESYSEFVYKLASFLENWMKGARAFDDKTKMFEEICLEQFCKTLPTKVKERVRDRSDVKTVRKAAEFADEYYAKHRSANTEKNTHVPGVPSMKPKFFRKLEKKDDDEVKKESSE